MPEIVSASNGRYGLEFLVVCNDSSQVFHAITEAIRAVKGRLNCASNLASAQDYIARRKIDGIVIDMALPGTLDLIDRVRRGSSNKFSVIFASNFVATRPTNVSQLERLFRAAAPMMVAEKRRFFRYPLMVPVQLTVDGKALEGTMANLSEGGMAIWCLQEPPRGSTLQFSFDLPFGGLIQGNGDLAWTGAEGTFGIKFHILQDRAYTHLSGWLSRCNHLPAPISRIHSSMLTGT